VGFGLVFVEFTLLRGLLGVGLDYHFTLDAVVPLCNIVSKSVRESFVSHVDIIEVAVDVVGLHYLLAQFGLQLLYCCDVLVLTLFLVFALVLVELVLLEVVFNICIEVSPQLDAFLLDLLLFLA